MVFMLSPGLAASAILLNSAVAKFSMSILFRVPRKDDPKSKVYQNASRAQLNEAEYAPLFLAALLFLHAKGIDAPWASTLAVFGQIAYFWGRLATGKMLPFAPLGSTPRYIALFLLAHAVYSTTA